MQPRHASKATLLYQVGGWFLDHFRSPSSIHETFTRSISQSITSTRIMSSYRHEKVCKQYTMTYTFCGHVHSWTEHHEPAATPGHTCRKVAHHKSRNFKEFSCCSLEKCLGGYDIAIQEVQRAKQEFDIFTSQMPKEMLPMLYLAVNLPVGGSIRRTTELAERYRVCDQHCLHMLTSEAPHLPRVGGNFSQVRYK